MVLFNGCPLKHAPILKEIAQENFKVNTLSYSIVTSIT